MNYLSIICCLFMWKCINAVEPCFPEECLLPDCKCSSTAIPDGFTPREIPQIVHLTFNEALTSTSQGFFQELFDGRFRNPNGCSFRATHFISHEYTDYSLVHEWWTKGHEMGTISITHKSNLTYWQLLNRTGWEIEMDGMRTILQQFGQIPEGEIVGMRCPDLQNGGDEQFGMMHSKDFLYDSSLPTIAFGFTHMAEGLWPYSMDYESIQDCQIMPCVSSSFPGVWEYPVLTLEDSRDIWGDGIGAPCSYIGGCQGFTEPDPDQIFQMLKKNFDRAYNGNRPPFGIHAQTGYFVGDQRWQFEGYLLFMEYLTQFPDVYVVPIIDGLRYVRDPVRLADIGYFQPFQCDEFPRPSQCISRQSCRFGVEDLPEELQGSGERYMNSCVRCPPLYPWLNNPLGAGI